MVASSKLRSGNPNGHGQPLGSFMIVVNNVLALCSRLEEHYKISIPHPKIIVIGGQSSGKSSVLEQLPQVQFLPTGNGTITKCPIEIKFHRSDQVRFTVQNVPYKNGDEVKAAIEKVSLEFAEKSGGISSEKVFVEIDSPNALDMTLIDLPGLIGVVKDDEDPNLIVRVRELTESYIRDPQCIILVVHPANTDFRLATSAQLARDADPDGRRTLAVLTKLDKVETDDDKSMLAKNLTLGQDLIKLGVISVVNRSAQQSFKEAKKIERAAIENIFTDQDAKKHGIEYLGECISRLLMDSMKEGMNETIRKLEESVDLETSNLQKYRRDDMDNKAEVLSKVLNQFGKEYHSVIDGTNRNPHSHNKGGGYQIRDLYEFTLKEGLSELDPSKFSDQNLVNAIFSARGSGGHTFLTETAFEEVVRAQIKQMEKPCKEMVEKIYSVVAKDMPRNCYPFICEFGESLYPPLQERILAEVQSLLKTPKEKTISRIEEYIGTQARTPKSYMDEFVSIWSDEKNKSHMLVTPQDRKDLLGEDPSGISSNPKLIFLREVIGKYFRFVLDQVRDHVPKIINYHLVYHAADTILFTVNELRQTAIANGEEEGLISEGLHIIAMRNAAIQRKAKLEEILEGFKKLKEMAAGKN